MQGKLHGNTMSFNHRILAFAPTIVVVTGCANAHALIDGGSSDSSDPTADASCGDLCDQDGDGVVDGNDQCPNTPPGEVVNHVGCADSQLVAMLEPTFPPYGLTWTSTGDLGRAGGLTWTYVGIQRNDLFHIDWILCDDPAEACGLSLDGAIDNAAEAWHFSADSDLVNGKLVFDNSTHILLADSTTPALAGRLTLTIVDANNAAIPFAGTAMLGVTGRLGEYGAEITGTAFTLVAIAEVQNPVTLTWTPFQDYYDAAATPPAGGSESSSFGGSFYDK
jgi:hypothetical protein